MQTSHLLALAVDLPRMTSEHLRQLAGKAQPGCGVAPFNQDHLEPLAGIYPKEAAAMAQTALASQDTSMRSFARELLRRGLLREHALAPQEIPLYFNINTPGDLLA
jgi:molybdopterin-guanine dinucleotide biosynthesis protein A